MVFVERRRREHLLVTIDADLGALARKHHVLSRRLVNGVAFGTRDIPLRVIGTLELEGSLTTCVARKAGLGPRFGGIRIVEREDLALSAAGVRVGGTRTVTYLTAFRTAVGKLGIRVSRHEEILVRILVAVPAHLGSCIPSFCLSRA